MPFNLIITVTSAKRRITYKVLEKSGTYFLSKIYEYYVNDKNMWSQIPPELRV